MHVCLRMNIRIYYAGGCPLSDAHDHIESQDTPGQRAAASAGGVVWRRQAEDDIHLWCAEIYGE